MKNNQKGFSALEMLVIVVIVGLIGAVGWLVWDRQKDSVSRQTTATPAKQEIKQQETAQKATSQTAKIPNGWVEYANKDYGVTLAQPDTWQAVTAAASKLSLGGGKFEEFYAISTCSPKSIRNDARCLGISIYDQTKTVVTARETAVKDNDYAITNSLAIFGNQNVTKIVITSKYNDIKLVNYVLEKAGKTYVVSGERQNADDDAQKDINALVPYLSIQ